MKYHSLKDLIKDMPQSKEYLVYVDGQFHKCGKAKAARLVASIYTETPRVFANAAGSITIDFELEGCR